MQEINMIKKPCPMPLIEAKKILQQQNNDGIIIRVDNLPAVKNLEKLATSLSSSFSFEKLKNNDYKVKIEKPTGIAFIKHQTASSIPNGLNTNSLDDIANLVIVISSDQMGNGSIELGKILIKSFLYSLTELNTPPSHIIFINSGVHLTCIAANILDTLATLKEKGANILSCGTCLNYYNLTEKLAIGEIANMYEITEVLSKKADKIISL